MCACVCVYMHAIFHIALCCFMLGAPYTLTLVYFGCVLYSEG